MNEVPILGQRANGQTFVSLQYDPETRVARGARMWKKHYFRMRNGFGLDTDIINELISRGCETVELRFSDVKRSYTTSPENLLLYGDDWKFDGNAQKIMRVDRWVEGALPRARRKRATA